MKNYLCVLIYILFLGVTMKTFATEVTSKEQKTFKLGAGGYISVIGDEGYINVESWDKDEVELVMNKHAWARSKREAEKLLNKIQVEINQTGNRLEIRPQFPQQPHHLHIPPAFLLQPPARPNPVEVPVQVQLQQVSRIVRRPSCSLRLPILEPESLHVQTIYKHVYHLYRIIFF